MKRKQRLRLSAMLCALLLLICALPMGLALAESQEGTINASGVNFRTGPGTTYSSQGKLDKGTAVTVSGTSGSWTKLTVTASGKSGYVFSRYVTVGKTTTSGKAGTVNANGVNFRKGPSTSYDVLGQLNKGAAVSVLGTSGSWTKLTVTASGKTGYVFSRYVTVSGGSATAAPSGNTAYINASGVNFRSGPSTRYTSLGKLDKNTAVTVTGTSGNWTKLTVTSSGKSGYVFSRYVTSNGTVTVTPAPFENKAGAVNVASVHLRNGPASSYKSLAVLHKDDAVVVNGISDKWYKVTVSASGMTGYVYGRYITLSGVITPTPQATPTPKPTPTPDATSGVIAP